MVKCSLPQLWLFVFLLLPVIVALKPLKADGSESEIDLSWKLLWCGSRVQSASLNAFTKFCPGSQLDTLVSVCCS